MVKGGGVLHQRGGRIKHRVTMSMIKLGFECEFVDPPPAVLQTNCPICLLVLREPYQVTCCGKSYCKACIERVIVRGQPCPCCLQDVASHFPNRGLQQPLYGFKVYCTHAEKGCCWTGELRQLCGHLNADPVENKQLEGCEFAEIRCMHCSESLQRSQLAAHQNSFCQKRPWICQYCNEFKSTYYDVVHKHHPVCGFHPIRCVNSCGQELQRQYLKSHLDYECPLASTDCEFKYAGCEVRPCRKDMSEHIEKNMYKHLKIVAEYYQRQLNETSSQFHQSLSNLESKLRQLQTEKDCLEQDLKEAKCIRVSDQMQVLPMTFTVDRYFQRKNHSQVWISDHFYTSERGYALYLRVRPYGSGPIATIAEYMSVDVHSIKGEFDKYLQWPLRRSLTIQVLSQKEGGKHHNRSILLELSRESSAGIWDFAYTVMLESRYLIKNSLQLRVL